MASLIFIRKIHTLNFYKTGNKLMQGEKYISIQKTCGKLHKFSTTLDKQIVEQIIRLPQSAFNLFVSLPRVFMGWSECVCRLDKIIFPKKNRTPFVTPTHHPAPKQCCTSAARWWHRRRGGTRTNVLVSTYYLQPFHQPQLLELCRSVHAVNCEWDK